MHTRGALRGDAQNFFHHLRHAVAIDIFHRKTLHARFVDERLLAIINIAWRLNTYHTELTATAGITIFSVVIALLVSIGATFGGSLVFDYGFNVETAGDHSVWHMSEQDVFPGHHGDADEAAT